IERRYPAEDLLMHDSRTIHFVYWDVSHRSVCGEFLDHIQQAGYGILYAGKAICHRRGTRRAWVECQKHEPEEENENKGTENNEFRLTPDGAYIGTIDESTDGINDFTLTCPNCHNKFTPEDAGTITIYGPITAHYTCPQCEHRTDGPSPLIT